MLAEHRGIRDDSIDINYDKTLSNVFICDVAYV